MFYNNRLILYLAFITYFITFYKCTWLPGSKVILHKAFYINGFITFLVLALLFEFKFLYTNIKLFYKENKYFTSLTILLMVSSFIFNFNEFLNPYKLSAYFSYLCYFLIYFVLLPQFFIRNPKYLYKFLYFVSFWSLGFSVLGLLFTYAGLTPESRFAGIVTSVFVHPNFVPSVCLVGLFSTLSLYFLNQERVLTQILLIISFILQFTALMASLTRDGMIAFLAGIVIFFFFYKRRNFIIALPFALAIIPGLLIAFIKTKGFASFLSRFLLLIPAYHLLLASKINLLWGYGVINASDMYVKYKIIYNVLEDVNSPHNAYISYILMYGLIFTAVFLFFIFRTIFKGMLIAYKEIDKTKLLYYSLTLSVIISYLVINLFESHLAMSDLTMMQPFLIFWGLLYFSIKKDLVPLKSFNDA